MSGSDWDDVVRRLNEVEAIQADTAQAVSVVARLTREAYRVLGDLVIATKHMEEVLSRWTPGT